MAKSKNQSSLTTSETTHVAVMQMCSNDSIEQNLKVIRQNCLHAADKKIQWISFPENCLLLTESHSSLVRKAISLNDPILIELCALAYQLNLWILLGSIPEKITGARNRVGNTSVLISNRGKIVATYRKMHLFDVSIAGDRSYCESDRIVAGTLPKMASVPWGKLGLSICYDIRFPELYRKYSKRGASFLSIPAAFTVPTGEAHWDVLTRARAIENQSFVLAPAQWGKHNSQRRTYGHSRIIDPWGKVLAEKKSGIGLISADLKLPELTRVRTSIPALQHRRF